MPASRSRIAATRPAIPAPTIATRSRPSAAEVAPATNDGIAAVPSAAAPAPRTKCARFILELDAEIGEEAKGLTDRRDSDFGNVKEGSVRIAQLRRRILHEVTRRREDVRRQSRVDARYRVVPRIAALEALIVKVDGLHGQRHTRRHVVTRLQIRRELRRLHERAEIVELAAVRVGQEDRTDRTARAARTRR